jgi:hypothetical protein
LLECLSTGQVSAHAGYDEGAVYTFDLGMIAAGLMSFGRRLGEARFHAEGEALAGRLGAMFLEHEEPPAIDPPGPPSGRELTWSNDPRPHLSKCVQAMLLAEQWDAAKRLIDHAAGFQHPSGYFMTQPREDLVMLHPHLYTVEAMWMWGTAREDESALARARAATEWAWQHQLPDGGLPRLVNLYGGQEPTPEQLDVTSQAVRAALLLDAEVDGVDRAVDRLCATAVNVDEAAALPYQPQSQQTHLNTWVTMFGAQALQLAAQGEDRSLQWHELV